MGFNSGLKGLKLLADYGHMNTTERPVHYKYAVLPYVSILTLQGRSAVNNIPKTKRISVKLQSN